MKEDSKEKTDKSEFPIVETVENFYKGLTEHKNHRYMSWEHCFKAFQKPNDEDYLSLQLAFYLASWGMYRGSTGLLWKDYKIHNDAIKILLDEKFDEIRCRSGYEIDENKIKKIIDVKNEISEYYASKDYIKPTKEGDKKDNITPTDTLVTKILLGTLGCVPAYDRFLLIGLKEKNIKQSCIKNEDGKRSYINKKSLPNLFDFVNKNITDLKSVQEKINQKEKDRYYPVMKIVDMYFWEVGRQMSPTKTKHLIEETP
ncbi:MAG: hypothetical protein WCO28_10655 [Bacteroidota bacterium]|jgi:hypothetical protein